MVELGHDNDLPDPAVFVEEILQFLIFRDPRRKDNGNSCPETDILNIGERRKGFQVAAEQAVRIHKCIAA